MNVLKKEVKKILYHLKKLYSKQIQLVFYSDSTFSVDTGTLVKTSIPIIIRKAIVLPVSKSKQFSYDLAYLAASRNFTYGGEYIQEDGWVIIERSDLEGNTINVSNTKCIVDGSSYNVVKTSSLVEELGIMFAIATSKGEK